MSKIETLVKIIPTSGRARNRVHEHGQVMRLLEVRHDRFLVSSLEATFFHDLWKGWFTNEEAKYEIVEDSS